MTALGLPPSSRLWEGPRLEDSHECEQRVVHSDRGASGVDLLGKKGSLTQKSFKGIEGAKVLILHMADLILIQSWVLCMYCPSSSSRSGPVSVEPGVNPGY